MNVLAEIYKWSRQLPRWQQDALRRLIYSESFVDTDTEEVTLLALKEAGVPVENPLVARTLTPAEVSEAVPEQQQVRLRAISNLRNVNAIASGQSLSFAANGLTIIYGDNGAGKSGYSRVLKRACLTRDEEDEVLPNAGKSNNIGNRPSATIEFLLSGEERTELWQENSTPPAALAAIAVFDSRCARIYVENENEATVVPYGLDIPEKLVEVCSKVKDKLRAQVAMLAFDPLPFSGLPQSTWAAAAVALLPSTLHLPALQQLAEVSPEEKQRKSSIEIALNEPDPLERIRIKEKLLKRVDDAIVNVANASLNLNDAAIENAKEARTQFDSARHQAEQAAKVLKEDTSLLPGTGSTLWRAMFEAARTFADGCNHPGTPFPQMGEDVRCPLCQQSLQDGGELFHRFQEFVTSRFEAIVEQRKKCCGLFASELGKTRATPLIEESVSIDLREVDEELANLISEASDSLSRRRDLMLVGLQSGEWPETVPALPLLSESISRFKSSIESEIAALRAASRGDREAMTKELKELEGRLLLAPMMDGVVATIAKEKRRLLILDAAEKITTTKISKKATELTNAAITAQLAERLNSEIAGLRFGSNFAVDLVAKSKKGVTKHSLKLRLSSAFPVHKVLSEGEQRALALAAFFAEAAGEDGIGSLVLDDPVSSLDHARRDVIARRIAIAAKDRQVIVFTHDLYFLRLLIDSAEVNDVSSTSRCVVRTADGPGVVRDGLPFHGKNTKHRVGELRQRCQNARVAWNLNDMEAYTPLARDIYRDLRDTWECCVEEVLLNETVVRFGKGVSTKRLQGVCVENDDYQQLDAGMTKCSNYAHDTAPIVGATIPDPNEIDSDIGALDEFRKRIAKRVEDVRKTR